MRVPAQSLDMWLDQLGQQGFLRGDFRRCMQKKSLLPDATILVASRAIMLRRGGSDSVTICGACEAFKRVFERRGENCAFRVNLRRLSPGR